MFGLRLDELAGIFLTGGYVGLSQVSGAITHPLEAIMQGKFIF